MKIRARNPKQRWNWIELNNINGDNIPDIQQYLVEQAYIHNMMYQELRIPAELFEDKVRK